MSASMLPPQDPANFEKLPGMDAMLREEGLASPPRLVVNDEPVYRKYAESRIAVAKSMGKHWKAKLDAARSARDPHAARWEEAIRYYEMAQDEHRESRDGTGGNKHRARRKNEQWSETENVIFSAIKAVVPAIYARNPVSEFTAADQDDEDQKKWVQALETLCNKLTHMRAPPGLNLKYKVKQAIVTAKLTNIAWMETGYTLREQSSEYAMADLERLSKELEKAKDQKEIRRIEGELMALEEKVSFLNPAGPFVRFWSPTDILVDPESVEPDRSDARWMAVEEYLPTDYLNAVYGEKGKDGKIVSVYKPDVVLLATQGGSGGHDDPIKNFKLFDTGSEASAYGYKDKDAFNKAHRTKCWRIYDKLTRRVYLYADNRWDWPVWVEDDQLKLPTFFPFEPLIFNVGPLGAYANSEVAYVMDQQDAINEINDTERRARLALSYKVIYNKKAGVDRTSILRVLTGAGPEAEGVNVPEGMKIDDLFHTPVPPILRAQPLYNKGEKIQTIDRLLGVTPSLRAAEYRTNTTNKAIEQYNSNTATRLDEQIDEIEEFLGRIFFNVAFMCAQFMSQQEVSELAGQKIAAAWKQVTSPTQLRQMFNMRIVGGSTVKPNSEAKRQQATMVGQTLGQFANAAPLTTVKVILRMFEQAFDEIGISDEDWVALQQEASQRAQSGGGGEGKPGASGGGPGPEQVAQLIDRLPPPAKEALGRALAQGVPFGEALPQILQSVAPQPGNGEPA